MAVSVATEFNTGAVAPSIVFMGIQSAGLVAGYAVGNITDFSWGQTLLIDLGGALGFVVAGTVLLASGGISPTVNSLFLSGATIGGAAATGAWLSTSNVAKDKTRRKGAMSYQIAPLMLQDKNASVAMGFALRGVTF